MDWLSRLTAGLALTGWSGTGSHSLGQNRTNPVYFTAQVWIRYHFLPDDPNGQELDHYEYLPAGQATTELWQQLSTGVRLNEQGTVEVSVGSDDATVQANFDDLRLEQTTGLIVQEQHQYAYGSPLTGLNYTIGNKRYRYGYQGQYAERDTATGWESFELRLYNSRIGRWTSYDPERQYDSPYLAMGNNPVSNVDPDGGLDLSILSDGVKTIVRNGRIVGFDVADGVAQSGLRAVGTQVGVAAFRSGINATGRPLGEGATISQTPANRVFLNDWSKGGFLAKTAYDIADNAWVSAQSLWPAKSEAGVKHLNNDMTSSSERIKALFGNLMWLAPFTKGIATGGLSAKSILGIEGVIGFTEHAPLQMASRGFTKDVVARIVLNGSSKLTRSARGTLQRTYSSGQNTVIVGLEGRSTNKIITVFSEKTVANPNGNYIR